MKINNISYTPVSNFLIQEKVDELIRYLHLSAEHGCGAEGKKLFDEFQAYLDNLADRYQALVLNQNDPDEPDDLETIRALRPAGARKLTDHLPKDYRKRLEGALYGRMAGCTLGAALEFEPVEKAKAWALHFGDQFPPADYWSLVKDPMSSHYITGKNIDLTKGHMNAVPPDDDTVYTLLGLLLMEQYGFDFTGENLAEVWKRYLPLGPKEDDPGQRGCWWGERQMLKCLLNGMTLPEAGLFRNPNLQNIAAWTRADSYGYGRKKPRSLLTVTLLPITAATAYTVPCSWPQSLPPLSLWMTQWKRCKSGFLKSQKTACLPRECAGLWNRIRLIISRHMFKNGSSNLSATVLTTITTCSGTGTSTLAVTALPKCCSTT